MNINITDNGSRLTIAKVVERVKQDFLAHPRLLVKITYKLGSEEITEYVGYSIMHAVRATAAQLSHRNLLELIGELFERTDIPTSTTCSIGFCRLRQSSTYAEIFIDLIMEMLMSQAESDPAIWVEMDRRDKFDDIREEARKNQGECFTPIYVRPRH